MAKKVLVVDDEKLIVKGIRFSLLQDDMEVDCAYDGEEALNLAKSNAYDMILLDVMLPKMDGFEVCQAIREFSDVPIIMLTAKGDDMDKILGLEYGADDYITKPFNILEVKARIKAIMRRTSPAKVVKEQTSVIEKGDIKLDCDSRRLFINDEEINLPIAKKFPRSRTSFGYFPPSHRRQEFSDNRSFRLDLRHFLSTGKRVRKLRNRRIFRNQCSGGKSPFRQASSQSHREGKYSRRQRRRNSSGRGS